MSLLLSLHTNWYHIRPSLEHLLCFYLKFLFYFMNLGYDVYEFRLRCKLSINIRTPTLMPNVPGGRL